MKCLDIRLFVLLSIILQGAACSWNGTSVHIEHNANLYSIETKSDQSMVYRYTNGASCTKRADYTEAMKAQGAIGVKQIFDTSVSIDTRMENAKKFGSKFEELEAGFFDICNQYGERRISLIQYNQHWDDYDRVRKRMFGQVSTISQVQGSFTETPVTPAGQAVIEYYKAVGLGTRDGYCHAWDLLSTEKRKQFDKFFHWTNCEQFGNEGFRTMEKYENIVLNEQNVLGQKTTVDEFIIAIDNIPENPARKEYFRRPAKELLNSKTLDQITEEIIRVIPLYYEVELSKDLLARVRQYIASSSVEDIMRSDFLEAIALSTEMNFKSYVFSIKIHSGQPRMHKSPPTERMRRLFINRREVVLEDGKWLLGPTVELSVTEYK